jgi:hypothetical protein
MHVPKIFIYSDYPEKTVNKTILLTNNGKSFERIDQ